MKYMYIDSLWIYVCRDMGRQMPGDLSKLRAGQINASCGMQAEKPF